MRVCLGAATMAAVLFAGACRRPVPPPEFRPVGDMKQMMNWVVDPAANVVWGAVSTVVSREGTEERGPDSDEAWADVRNHAAVLAEAGNLLLMNDRAPDRDAWTGFAHALTSAAQAAIRAAEARDRSALLRAGEQICPVCLDCHQRYAPGLGPTMPR